MRSTPETIYCESTRLSRKSSASQYYVFKSYNTQPLFIVAGRTSCSFPLLPLPLSNLRAAILFFPPRPSVCPTTQRNDDLLRLHCPPSPLSLQIFGSDVPVYFSDFPRRIAMKRNRLVPAMVQLVPRIPIGLDFPRVASANLLRRFFNVVCDHPRFFESSGGFFFFRVRSTESRLELRAKSSGRIFII